ncbi:hypothetical protein FVEG_10992 [Fusarium verticillioides 7600]|uniref:Uncharacterized protein n=1 Tax=Gibberella moniliformis (strain M3125 / FGSC 7600) TaxID=334819 RepID=W7N6E8_GIBM7|nr:hypothetical protein FVEG_10992 [Fusarium verticillioides 7600]EWG52197.1 hypothetical protein FVEG_10992 [Fusarium verticillioides 7600]
MPPLRYRTDCPHEPDDVLNVRSGGLNKPRSIATQIPASWLPRAFIPMMLTSFKPRRRRRTPSSIRDYVASTAKH